jgi:hypothetical protein
MGMKCRWQTTLVALLLTVGCSQAVSNMPGQVIGSPSPSPSGNANDPLVVRRTLDFEAPKVDGPVVARLPYGQRPSRLGGVPSCLNEKCEPPCPCSVPLAPRSFEVDSQQRLWINDHAKGRIAIFDFGGNYLFNVAPQGNNYINVDVQQFGEDILVSRTRGGRPRYIHLRERQVVGIYTLTTEGKRYTGGEHLTTTQAGERVFTFLYEQSGSLECCFGLAELMPPVNGVIDSHGVPGVAYRETGWLIEDTARANEIGTHRAIVYRAEHPEPWSVELRLRMLQERQGQTRRVNGIVSWDAEADAAGTLHLVIFAGSTGSVKENGFWYVTIGPTGEVGEPVPLWAPGLNRGSRRPSPPDQFRWLTLDQAGAPYVMWSGPRAVTVVSLRDLAQH